MPNEVTVRSMATGEVLRVEKQRPIVGAKKTTPRHEHRWGPWRKTAYFSTQEVRRCEKRRCGKAQYRQASITSDLESLL